MGDDHHPTYNLSYTPHTMSATPKLGASEDILGHKTDLSISNLIVKTGTGFGAGVLLSAILFRRRAWPVWLFTGVGIGSGYSDANRIFNPAAIPGYKIAEKPAKA